MVERHPLDYMGELLKQGYATVVLKFWSREREQVLGLKRGSSTGPQSPSFLSNISGDQKNFGSVPLSSIPGSSAPSGPSSGAWTPVEPPVRAAPRRACLADPFDNPL